MSFHDRFINIGQPERIWTISAPNGQLPRLTAVHRAIYDRFQPGDRIVYTGNYLCGKDASPLATLDEILHFGSCLTKMDGVQHCDITFLRGIQEELFEKLLHLQFAQNPPQIVEWMQRHYPEMDSLLVSYGSTLADTARIAREGILSMTRWSNALKARLREHAGHDEFFMSLKRAAFTECKDANSNDNNLLFVHAGINPKLPLMSQGDSFWWSSKNFNDIETPYAPFRTVIRGHDPHGKGVHVGQSTISLDGGCGKTGGRLILAELSGTGQVLNLIAA